jgi:O-antigen/teichoic acid export membrane protein
MSNIRVTYSGLVSFGSGLINIGTSLIFVLIITRTLSQQEYGTWGLITSLFVYGMLTSSIVNFWTIRGIARGEKVGKISLVSSGLFSIIGVCMYLGISLFIAPQSSSEINLFLISTILIPINFLSKAISSINLGWRPQVSSYGILLVGITSIPLALFFIYFLDWSIIGIITTLALAQSVNIVYQTICARNKIKTKIELKILKRWVKFSWLPIYPAITRLLYTTDVIIFSLITGSVIGISYYSAAIVIASFVGHASVISTSVYSKLLSGDKGNMISKNLTHLAYFMCPMFFLAITFAKPGLFILNPIYGIAVLPVIFITCSTLLFSLTGIFESFLLGTETVDKETDITFKKSIKSRLFLIPSLHLIQYTVYLTVFAIVMVLLQDSNNNLELVIYWSLILVIFQIPFTIYRFYSIKQTFQLKIEVNSIIKYIIASLFSFSLIYILMEKFLVYNESIFKFLPTVLIFVFSAIIMYLLITFVIDKSTRNLLKSIISEIKNKL